MTYIERFLDNFSNCAVTGDWDGARHYGRRAAALIEKEIEEQRRSVHRGVGEDGAKVRVSPDDGEGR